MLNSIDKFSEYKFSEQQFCVSIGYILLRVWLTDGPHSVCGLQTIDVLRDALPCEFVNKRVRKSVDLMAASCWICL